MSRRSERTISVLVPPDLASTAPEDPAQIGPYVLIGRLGSGRTGTVYAAVHPTVEPDVLLAVRTLLPSHAADDAARTQLDRRLRALSGADGRCYVPPVAFDAHAEPPWLAMRYASGMPLSQYTRKRGPMSPGRLIALAAGLGEALSALHALDLAHGDLKPSNILLSSTGPRVLDCALPGDAEVVHRSAAWLGPERHRGAPPSEAADVFSWGAVLAFAATGRLPFGMGDPDTFVQRVESAAPDLDGVPAEIRPLLESALAKDADQRPRVREVVRASIELWEEGLGTVGSEAGPGSGVTRLLHREWQGIVEPALLPRVVRLAGRSKGWKGSRKKAVAAAPAPSRSGSPAPPAPAPPPVPAAPTASPPSPSEPGTSAPPPEGPAKTAAPASAAGEAVGRTKPDRRPLLLAGGGVLALLLVGGAAWAATSALGGAPDPEPAEGSVTTAPDASPVAVPPELDSGTIVVRFDGPGEANLISGPWPYTPIDPVGGDAFAGQDGSELTPEQWSARWNPVDGVSTPLEALIAPDAEVKCAHFCLNPDQVYTDEQGRGTYAVTGRDLASYLGWGDVVIAEVTFGDPDPETGLPLIVEVTELYPPVR